MKKDKVQALREIAIGPNPQLIEVVKGLLERAEAGECQGMAFITVNLGGEYGSCYVLEPQQVDLLGVVGMVEFLKQRLIREQVEMP